jgi:hypothetical protein
MAITFKNNNMRFTKFVYLQTLQDPQWLIDIKFLGKEVLH